MKKNILIIGLIIVLIILALMLDNANQEICYLTQDLAYYEIEADGIGEMPVCD